MTDSSAPIKSTDREVQRVIWHSRRGMLELDLAFSPFAREVYADLSAEDQLAYRRLLESEDTDLFQWVLKASRPQDEDLAMMMDKVLAYAVERSATSQG